MHNRHEHDCSLAIAWRVLESVKSHVPKEEHFDAMAEFYEVARQEIDWMLAAIKHR